MNGLTSRCARRPITVGTAGSRPRKRTRHIASRARPAYENNDGGVLVSLSTQSRFVSRLEARCGAIPSAAILDAFFYLNRAGIMRFFVFAERGVIVE